jgi:hypothetical protein
MKDNMVEIFDSLPFLTFESEGSFGRHYRFINTRYKVILYTKHIENERGWTLSYHKEIKWEARKINSLPAGAVKGWFNSSFEEIFEKVEPELKEQLSWHLDLFR